MTNYYYYCKLCEFVHGAGLVGGGNVTRNNNNNNNKL